MFYAFFMAHYAPLDFYLEDTVVKYTAYTFKNLKTTFYSWEKITRNTSFQSIAGLEQKNKKGWIFVSGLNIQCTCQRLLQSLKASPGKSLITMWENNNTSERESQTTALPPKLQSHIFTVAAFVADHVLFVLQIHLSDAALVGGKRSSVICTKKSKQTDRQRIKQKKKSQIS